jgi:hypothetical protein
MSGVTNNVSFVYYNNRIDADYNGGDVASSGFAVGDNIGLRIVNTPSGVGSATATTLVKKEHCSHIYDGRPGPDGILTDRWVQHRVRITPTGVYMGSDAASSGNIIDYIYGSSLDNVAFNNVTGLTRLEVYIPYAPVDESIWIDDIYVTSSGVTITSGTWNDGTFQGWTAVNGSYSGLIVEDPLDPSSKSLTTVSGQNPVNIVKSFNPISLASGNIELLYKLYYPGDQYQAEVTNWTEFRQIYKKVWKRFRNFKMG